MSVIYFLQMQPNGPIKIGCSTQPKLRRETLQGWSPYELKILATVPGKFDLESNIHDCFADLHMRGEWFSPGDRLIASINKIASGVPVEIAIDLGARVASIKAKRPRKREITSSPNYKKYCSYNHLLRPGLRKRGFAIPLDASRILHRWQKNYEALPSAPEFARLDEILKNPHGFCEPWRPWRPITERYVDAWLSQGAAA